MNYRLFKLIVEIKYPSNPPEIFKFREKIIASVAKEDKVVPPNFSEGFSFNVKKRLMKVAVERERLAADMIFPENISNPMQYGEENISKLIRQINSSLDIKTIERIGVKTQWFTPVDINMEELIERFKEKFFLPSIDLISTAKDIAIVLNLEDNERLIHYNSGPMGQDQLKPFVEANFKEYGYDREETIPNNIIFVDYDYFSNNKKEYSDSFVREFIGRAISKAHVSVTETSKILGY
jgi:hypothetical protein